MTVVSAAPKLFEVGPKDVEVHPLLDPFPVPMEGSLLIKLSRDGLEESRTKGRKPLVGPVGACGPDTSAGVAPVGTSPASLFR